MHKIKSKSKIDGTVWIMEVQETVKNIEASISGAEDPLSLEIPVFHSLIGRMEKRDTEVRDIALCIIYSELGIDDPMFPETTIFHHLIKKMEKWVGKNSSAIVTKKDLESIRCTGGFARLDGGTKVIENDMEKSKLMIAKIIASGEKDFQQMTPEAESRML